MGARAAVVALALVWMFACDSGGAVKPAEARDAPSTCKQELKVVTAELAEARRETRECGDMTATLHNLVTQTDTVLLAAGKTASEATPKRLLECRVQLQDCGIALTTAAAYMVIEESKMRPRPACVKKEDLVASSPPWFCTYSIENPVLSLCFKSAATCEAKREKFAGEGDLFVPCVGKNRAFCYVARSKDGDVFNTCFEEEKTCLTVLKEARKVAQKILADCSEE